jgi:hypothetical protein
VDAALSGPGIWGFEFDLERFLDYLPRHKGKMADLRHWVDTAEEVYMIVSRDVSGYVVIRCMSNEINGLRLNDVIG